MSEQKKLTVFQRQKITKPIIEEIIPEIITNGDIRKNILDFVAYLRTNNMSFRWSGVNTWKAYIKSKCICRVALGKIVWSGKNSDFWWVVLSLTNLNEYKESITDSRVQKIIRDNIKYCNKCSGCTPGIEMTIAGIELKNICRDLSVVICDPDEEVLNGIKTLLELEQQARMENIGK